MMFPTHRATTRRTALDLAVLCVAGFALVACDVRFSTAHVAEATTALDAEGRRPTSTFGPTDPFFVAGRLANAPADTALSATWIAVAVDAEGVAPGLVLDTTEVEGGSGPFHFQLTNDTPWPTGRYRVELRLNGEPDRALDFTVATDAATVGASVAEPVAAPASAPAARPSPETVLASRDGHVFRQAHLDQGLELIRFLSGEPATAAEATRLRADALRQFDQDPVQFAEGMAFIDQVLTAARSTSNVLEIAAYRMLLFNTFYTANQQLPPAERPALLEIVFEKSRVLAYDPETQLVLTARDLRGAVEILAFGAGRSLGENEARRQVTEFEHTLAPRFTALGPEEKQYLATAGLLWEVLSANLDTFSAQQRAALRQSVAPALPPSAPPPATWSDTSSIDADTARFLSQLSLQQHVSTLNVIENLGGTGDYWELRPTY